MARGRVGLDISADAAQPIRVLSDLEQRVQRMDEEPIRPKVDETSALRSLERIREDAKKLEEPIPIQFDESEIRSATQRIRSLMQDAVDVDALVDFGRVEGDIKNLGAQLRSELSTALGGLSLGGGGFGRGAVLGSAAAGLSIAGFLLYQQLQAEGSASPQAIIRPVLEGGHWLPQEGAMEDLEKAGRPGGAFDFWPFNLFRADEPGPTSFSGGIPNPLAGLFVSDAHAAVSATKPWVEAAVALGRSPAAISGAAATGGTAVGTASVGLFSSAAGVASGLGIDRLLGALGNAFAGGGFSDYYLKNLQASAAAIGFRNTLYDQAAALGLSPENIDTLIAEDVEATRLTTGQVRELYARGFAISDPGFVSANFPYLVDAARYYLTTIGEDAGFAGIRDVFDRVLEGQSMEEFLRVSQDERLFDSYREALAAELAGLSPEAGSGVAGLPAAAVAGRRAFSEVARDPKIRALVAQQGFTTQARALQTFQQVQQGRDKTFQLTLGTLVEQVATQQKSVADAAAELGVALGEKYTSLPALESLTQVLEDVQQGRVSVGLVEIAADTDPTTINKILADREAIQRTLYEEQYRTRQTLFESATTELESRVNLFRQLTPEEAAFPSEEKLALRERETMFARDVVVFDRDLRELRGELGLSEEELTRRVRLRLGGTVDETTGLVTGGTLGALTDEEARDTPDYRLQAPLVLQIVEAQRRRSSAEIERERNLRELQRLQQAEFEQSLLSERALRATRVDYSLPTLLPSPLGAPQVIPGGPGGRGLVLGGVPGSRPGTYLQFNELLDAELELEYRSVEALTNPRRASVVRPVLDAGTREWLEEFGVNPDNPQYQVRPRRFYTDAEYQKNTHDLLRDIGITPRDQDTTAADYTRRQLAAFLGANTYQLARTPGDITYQSVGNLAAAGVGVGVGTYIGAAVGGPWGAALGGFTGGLTESLLGETVDLLGDIAGFSRPKVAEADVGIFGTERISSSRAILDGIVQPVAVTVNIGKVEANDPEALADRLEPVLEDRIARGTFIPRDGYYSKGDR